MNDRERGGLEPWEDPLDPGNGVSWVTGHDCIVQGCREAAGTKWDRLRCREHNAARCERVAGKGQEPGAGQ